MKEDELIEEITGSINQFRKIQHAKVDIKLTESGQFRIECNGDKARVSIEHSWGDPKWSFAQPNTIDITFTDKESSESFLIIITVYEEDLFLDSLTIAKKRVEQFLQHRFTRIKKRRLLIFHSEYIKFDGDDLYGTALLINKKSKP